MMRYILVCFLSLCLSTMLDAQDPRFSQFNASQIHINPAFTGLFDGNYKISLNYRDQWSSVLGDNPFRTMAAGFEYKLNVSDQDHFGFAVSVLRDEVGVAEFSQTKGHVGASYTMEVAENHHVGIGAQIGAGQNALDWGNLWFSRQFNPFTEQVDMGLPNGENENGKSDVYLDMNVGLLWYGSFGENISVLAGGSYMHLNEPVITFLNDQSESLYTRWVGHITVDMNLGKTVSLQPSVVSSGQGPSQETVVGSAFRYDTGDYREVAMRVGLFGRIANKFVTVDETTTHMDAVIVAANLEYEGFNIGLSYDINTSSLSAATQSRGAFEISLTYIHQRESGRKKGIGTPRF